MFSCFQPHLRQALPQSLVSPCLPKLAKNSPKTRSQLGGTRARLPVITQILWRAHRDYAAQMEFAPYIWRLYGEIM